MRCRLHLERRTHRTLSRCHCWCDVRQSCPRRSSLLLGWRCVFYSPATCHFILLTSTPSFAISYSGESSRSRDTVSTTRSATYSTSSSVLKRPRPKRIEVLARYSTTPRAFNQ